LIGILKLSFSLFKTLPLTRLQVAQVYENLMAEFEQRFPDIAAELGHENLTRFLEACVVVELPEGRQLFRDRMQVESLYMLLEGEMVATVEGASRNRGSDALTVGQIRPGAWLGEVAVLSGDMHASATVTTKTRCRVLKIHSQDFERFVLYDEDISHVLLGHLVDILAQRLRESHAVEETLH
jgi:CRP-like cAMP-binding protein